METERTPVSGMYSTTLLIPLLPAHGAQLTATCLDCHTLQLTSRTGKSLVNCSATNLPYCDNSTASCSLNASAECINPDNFTCLSDGYFPDPWNCQAFHLCVNLVPTKYICESDSSYDYYDVVLHRCASSAVCGYKCYGKSGVKTPHPGDPNLYAYCVNGTAFLQDRCPGNYELNEVTERCEVVCHADGLVADVDDCTKFYRCSYQNYGYFRSHESCPAGQEFNPLTLQCDNGPAYCQIGRHQTK